MKNSNIEWTGDTDNIIVVDGGGWWCSKISSGCANCYSERINKSGLFGGNGLAYRGEPPKLILRREIIAGWARQKRARKHFICSMTDLFGEWVPKEWMFEAMDGMLAAPRQTFQLLTKRDYVCVKACIQWAESRQLNEWPSNIWLGFSAENQECFDERWNTFSGAFTFGRFRPIVWVSAEPLLAEIILPISYRTYPKAWVVAGGESGPAARPMHPQWPRRLRDQCEDSKIPYFFKQWGEFLSISDAAAMGIKRPICELLNSNWLGGGFLRVGKRAAGRLLDGEEWSQFPSEAA